MPQLTKAQLAELASLCPSGVECNVSLSELSRWRIGGSADVFLRPSSSAEVSSLMKWFYNRNIQPVVIGLTSNLLFDDDGLRVPCIQIGPRMSKISVDGCIVNSMAGVWVPGFARRVMLHDLSGVEHICGIPGALGGLVCMNGGSQRKGVGSSIVLVESVDAKGVVRVRTTKECEFGYRKSIYQSNLEVITGVQLKLAQRQRQQVRSDMRRILAERRKKFPRKLPNCGSVFKSDPQMYSSVGPPGAVIERLGLKGQRVGLAMVSEQHANFIVNEGGATAKDVIQLISYIAREVESRTGFRLQSEPFFVRSDGKVLPADSVANCSG